MSQLRDIVIHGPKVGKRTLWRAEIAVAYSGKNSPKRPVVQKTHALRVLVQENGVTKEAGVAEFHRPLLLHAAVEPYNGDHRLILGISAEDEKGYDFRQDPAIAYSDVLLAPHGDAAWPRGSEIEVPEFDLAAGRISAWVRLRRDS